MIVALAVMLTACQIPKKPAKDAPSPSVEPQSLDTAVPVSNPPEPSIVPGSPEARRQAQTLALQAATLLDEGREAEARDVLRSALSMDERNEIGRKLQFSLEAEPEKELGSKNFRYTVKAGDTLSRIAEQFLNDQYKFYLLARYNGIAVPRSLKSDQVIKVPGVRPASLPTAAGAEENKPDRTSKDVKVPAMSASADLLQQCTRLWAAGERERALTRCEEAVNATPREPGAQPTLERYRNELVQTYERKAREAYRRQDLDGCIKAWGKVLQMNSAHEFAARERDRCSRLKVELEKSAK